MSRLGVLVTRRFTSRATGREELTELCRAVELSIPPASGQRLVFPDGAECTVSMVRHKCGLTALGVLPLEIEVVACRESAAGLDAALAAGWQPVPSPAPASV